MSDLTTIKDRVYENRRLTVDGGRFVRCRFINSKLVYSGTDEVSFEECSFEECEWVFAEAADRTLSYLSMLQRQGGSAGKGVVAAAVDALDTELFFDPISAASVAS